MEAYDQQSLGELAAEVRGVRANQEILDVNMRRWRDVSSSALLSLTQREAREDREREARQRKLDRWLWGLTIGVGCCLLLLIVLISLFVGSNIA